MIENDFGIAIIGAGCRFPAANSISEFWNLLWNGVDAISEIPSTRFDVDAYYDPRPGVPGRIITRHGGFLADIDKFDPYFFGISPREAAGIDPQHRLLLETAWQCVEDAGVTSQLLARSRAGVFVGVCTDDYQAIGRVAADHIDVRFAMGIARSNAAGRISYLLGLTGPSLCLDTACSSSLLAIHLAVRSLREGECEMAFAGGVNAILEPTTMIAFSQSGLLSPDGRCKAFDESADGFVRSEGAGMVLLKPLRRAIADGDPIYAVIRGSATNNDGPASLFMAPSRDGQEAVLRAACADAEVSPADIQYVEAHGTGTQVGDPIEIESLAAVMGPGRGLDAPLHVGSVKTNIGHLEGGAGVAGVIKTALILRHGFIPANLHLQNPTSGVPWDRLPISLPRHAVRWPQNKPRLAGVSSFGISGTNVHAILEGAPPEPARERPFSAPSRPHVLLISARDQRSLTESARLWENHLASATDDIGDICHSSATRRNHFDHRLSIVGQSRQEMIAALSSWCRGESSPGFVVGRSAGSEWRKPVFVFSGVGSQWPHMGLALRESYPVFRAALEQAEELIARFAGWSLFEELSRDEHSTRFGRIDIFQPASVAVQLALAKLWISWGIEPGLVIGHSVGEIPAAHVAGSISFEQAMEITVLRSEVMHRAADTGAMLACELTPDSAARFLKGVKDRVSVGVVNGPNALVLSGDKIILNRIATDLEHRDIFCRFVRMPVPSHSPLMEPLLAELKQRVAHIHPEAARIPMISTVDNRVHHGEVLTPEYWARNLRGTVQFAEAVAVAFDRGEDVFVEVSPHAMLIDHIRKAGSERSRPCLVLPSMRRGEDGRMVMLESLGQMHCNGYPVDWLAHERADARYVRIPGHPLRAERFWLDTSGISSVNLRGRRQGSHAMLPDSWMPADRPSTHIWEFTLSTDEFPFLAEHAFQGHPILPGAAYCELLAAATDAIFGPGPKVFRNIQFHRSLFLDQETRANVQIVLEPEENGSVPIRFYVKSGMHAWELYFEAIFLLNDNSLPALAQPFDTGSVQSRLPVVLSESEFYATAGLVGLEYGPCFRSIRKTWSDNSTESLGQVQVPDFLTAEAKHFKLHPAVLDSLFQITLAELVKSSNGKPVMPFSLEELRIGKVCAAPEFWVHCIHRDAPKGFGLNDIDAIAPDGRVLVSLRGLQSKVVGRTAEASEAHETDKWVYQVRWDRSVTPGGDSTPGSWLILGDESRMSGLLQSCLERRRQHCLVAPLRGTDKDALSNLLANFRSGSQIPWQGIVYLGALGAGADAADSSFDEGRLLMEQKEICGGLLQIFQSHEAIRKPETPRLFVITRGAQRVSAGDGPVELAQGPILGFTRSAGLEHPEFAATMIDIDPLEGEASLDQLVRELLASSDEREIALRGKDRYVARLARLDVENLPRRNRLLRIAEHSEGSYRVITNSPGLLDRIDIESTFRRVPGPEEIEVRVAAAGLNFLDVLRSLNMYPGQEPGDIAFGMECAGQVLRVGKGVSRFKPGDRVIALPAPNAGCFEAYLTIPERQAFPVPGGISLEQAATIPVAYQTAWYALHHLGRLRKGESVLIHAGAGGVGLAAVQIAKYLGAKIFATAGSEEKREYLRQLGVDHVMDSRTLAFAREVMEITDGRGVDMVLNSIAGAAIPKSLSVLAVSGRFMEIGKRDIYANSSLGLSPFRRNLSFFAIDMLGLSIDKPEILEDLTREILELVKAGSFGALPYTAFRASEAREAFRLMAQAQHIGKVVLTFEETEVEAQVPEKLLIRQNATYLITGGLTGLGLECAQWLAKEGAGNLVLAGRRAPDPRALEAMAAIRADGTNVRAASVDVSHAGQLEALLFEIRRGMPPLAGVIHSAGLLRDAIVDNLKWPDCEAVMAPKLGGGSNLQRALDGAELDFFVLFSSIASTLGSPGQANYSAANAFLDSLGQYRSQLGMPVLNINWGPWSEIGLAARPDRGGRMAETGMPGIAPADGIAVLRRLLQKQCDSAAVMRVDWKNWAQYQPGIAAAPFLRYLQGEMRGERDETVESSFTVQIRALEREQAIEAIEQSLREEVKRVLRIPDDRLDRHTSLTRLGLDSLMAVELKNRIDSKIAIPIPVIRLLKGPTLAEMSNMLYDTLKDGLPANAEAVDSLSDAEVETMLRQFTD